MSAEIFLPAEMIMSEERNCFHLCEAFCKPSAGEIRFHSGAAGHLKLF